MKRRFDLKYQLFINEQTGVATCKLIDIKLANWVNAGTCINYDLLVGAKNTIIFRYQRQGWPVTHATPSKTAKRNDTFGMKLAKKRLLYKVLHDLYEEMDLLVDMWFNDVLQQSTHLLKMHDILNNLDDSITDMYIKAGINEGDYMADIPKEQLRALSNTDRWERIIHPEPVDDKGGDNNG